MNVGGVNQHAEQNNSWLCGMGGILCHAMLCMHVLDSRRCRVHGVHQNVDAESHGNDNVRAERQCKCRDMGTSGVAVLCHSGFARGACRPPCHPVACLQIAPLSSAS